MLTTIDVLTVQCLELLSCMSLHSSVIMLELCHIDRIIRLLSEQIAHRSADLGDLLTCAADSIPGSEEPMQVALVDMATSNEDHDSSTATTHASVSTRCSDIQDKMTSIQFTDLEMISDKLSVLKVIAVISSLDRQ